MFCFQDDSSSLAFLLAVELQLFVTLVPECYLGRRPNPGVRFDDLRIAVVGGCGEGIVGGGYWEWSDDLFVHWQAEDGTP